MVDRITLYRAPTTAADVPAVAAWLRPRVDASVTVRDRFLDCHCSDDTAEQFAAARVLSPYDRETGNTMLGIVRYEERVLDSPEREGGVLYDGLAVQRTLHDALPENERSPDHLHVPVLNRAVATWGDHDGRWHKRVNVLGHPSVVSVPGLYEAPAKPEAYYKEQQKHAMLSGDTPPREVLENQVEGDFLIEDDPRTTDALKGYVLQAVHYLETGTAFCETAGCRLYNAHRQPALLDSQLRDPEFCAQHSHYEPVGSD